MSPRSSRSLGRTLAAVLSALLLVPLVLVVAAQPASAADTAQPAQAADGFYVRDGRLYDANGSDFVMRGVNHPYAWYKGQNHSFADIKRLGSNTVRVVLDLNVTSSEVTTVINLCKSNRLICMLEIHDTTGYGEKSAATLAQAAAWWVARKDVLVGQERYVLINIGNEPYGNNGTSGWTNATIGAIRTIRDAGLQHTLVVDAPNWGQDWSGVMRTNAPSVFAADTLRNTVFSIHMYGVYGQAATINNYLQAFIDMRLPIIVGEFGNNHSDGDVDEDTIFATAQAKGIGYLGWSWSGNNSPVQYLDMTNGFNANSLTAWGQRIINGANGIRATSREASVYSDAPPTSAALRGVGSGKCVDVPGASQTNGTGLIIYTCSGASNQRWTHTSANELRIYNNSKCMEAGTSAGSRAVITSCTGSSSQKWTFNANGTISNVGSGLCLDVNAGSTANNAAVNVWTCHGRSNQLWTRQA